MIVFHLNTQCSFICDDQMLCNTDTLCIMQQNMYCFNTHTTTAGLKMMIISVKKVFYKMKLIKLFIVHRFF